VPIIGTARLRAAYGGNIPPALVDAAIQICHVERRRVGRLAAHLERDALHHRGAGAHSRFAHSNRARELEFEMKPLIPLIVMMDSCGRPAIPSGLRL
jgi:hypothetical protein